MAIDVWADTVETVAVALAVGAAFVAVRQVRLARFGGGGANVMAFWSMLQSEEARRNRKTLFDAFERAGAYNPDAGASDLATWSAEEIAAAESVCALWSVAGAMVKYRLLPADIVLDEWRGQIHRTWAAAEALAIQRRIDYADPGRWASYEWLAAHT